MSRRTVVILGVSVVALALGLEWAFRFGSAGTGCAQVINEGLTPMEGLIANYGGSKVIAGTLAPGEKIKVWFSNAGKGPLSLEFTQSGNPLKGFKVDDFDPIELRHDGSRLVLVVKTGQVMRFVEEEESMKSPPRMLDRLIEWLRDELR